MNIIESIRRLLKKNFSPNASIDEVGLLSQFLADKKDGTMLDVGAHFGSSAKKFLDLGWTVFCFEPDNSNRERLEKFCSNYPADKFEISNRAVSDTDDEELDYFTSDISTGISSVVKFHESHNSTQKVKTISLSTFLKTKTILNDKIDLLKIDTEGNDLMILKGYPWYKENLHPEVIICEFEDYKTINKGYGFNDIKSLLKSHNYHLITSKWFPVVAYGRQHTWDRFHEEDWNSPDLRDWGNILAFKNKETLNQFKEKFSNLV
jgi:FkbM family methyltransferase